MFHSLPTINKNKSVLLNWVYVSTMLIAINTVLYHLLYCVGFIGIFRKSIYYLVGIHQVRIVINRNKYNVKYTKMVFFKFDLLYLSINFLLFKMLLLYYSYEIIILSYLAVICQGHDVLICLQMTLNYEVLQSNK